MLVKLDHFPKDRGEHKQCLKPPPSRRCSKSTIIVGDWDVFLTAEWRHICAFADYLCMRYLPPFLPEPESFLNRGTLSHFMPICNPLSRTGWSRKANTFNNCKQTLVDRFTSAPNPTPILNFPTSTTHIPRWIERSAHPWNA